MPVRCGKVVGDGQEPGEKIKGARENGGVIGQKGLLLTDRGDTPGDADSGNLAYLHAEWPGRVAATKMTKIFNATALRAEVDFLQITLTGDKPETRET